MTYSSLHNHTMYSLQDGYGTVEEMFARANDIGLKALAITEHNNVYSAPYLYKVGKNYPNIKLIYGNEFYECFDTNVKDKENKYFHLIALARNEKGRVAINELITKSEFYGKYFKGRVDLKMMKPYGEDLVITTACMASKLHREKDYDKCVKYIEEYKEVFPYFYLELQSHDNIEQEEYNKKLLKLANDTKTPFIITTDSHVAYEKDLKYQARHVQIAQDGDTASEHYGGCYLQSVDEIHEIMDKQIGRENVCLGLLATNIITDIVIKEDVHVRFVEPELPHFPLPDGFSNTSDYLRHLCEVGWEKRKLDNRYNEEELQERKERLDMELEVIKDMGYEGYFLILWDALNWARDNEVEINHGRGSGASSIVNYLLFITSLDPVKYKLVFERFLNKERQGMPDVDVDLDPKDKVIDYLKAKYEAMRVCQVMNFSEITPIVAIKDSARVLDNDKNRFEMFGKKISSKVANDISKLFTETTFEESYDKNKSTIKQKYDNEIYQELFELAKALSGRVRHVSTHAGGVCIANTSVNDYMPMRLTDKNEQVIHADKKMVEALGLVKYDFLGLNTLSVIRETKKLANLSNWDLDPNNEKFINDEKSFELIGTGETNRIFQLESQGMKDLCFRLKPKNLEDLSAILALYRPDSMGMLEDYVARKNGEKPIEYMHQDMEDILKDTLGAWVYQEQILQITRRFGGRSYAEADLLRRAIGKKNPEEVQRESQKLFKEIVNNGYSEGLAKQIFDEMNAKGNYSFNLSHSMAYSVTSLQTAYLKAHYPVEFYCAVLNSVKGDTGKINKYVNDAQNNNIKVLPPHINKSEKEFVVNDGNILFGLSSITKVGDKLVDEIISERQEYGNFKGMDDFLSRVKCNKQHVVSLIKSGSFPTKSKYNSLLNYCSKVFMNDKEYPEYKPTKSLPTLLVLKTEFGIDTDVVKNKDERLELYNQARKKLHETVKRTDWEQKNKLSLEKEIEAFKEKYVNDEEYWEFESLSIFLSTNPLKELQQYITQDFHEVEEGDDCIIVGIVSSIQKKKDKNKNDYCYVNVYESCGIVEGICWNSVYKKYIELIKKGEKLAFYGQKNTEDTFVVKKIKTIEEWKEDRNI